MTTEREPVAARPPRRGALGVILRQWPLLIVLGGGVTALFVVASGNFRLGCTLLGASVGFAAVARAVI